MIGKILLRLQEHLKRWIKPATSVLISALSDLTRSRTDLLIENALLRQTTDRAKTADQTTTTKKS